MNKGRQQMAFILVNHRQVSIIKLKSCTLSIADLHSGKDLLKISLLCPQHSERLLCPYTQPYPSETLRHRLESMFFNS